MNQTGTGETVSGEVVGKALAERAESSPWGAEAAKRRGLVEGIESSTGSPTLTGSEVLRKTGDPLTDALTDIKRGVTVDEASIRYGIPVERLARLSGKEAAIIPEGDLFAPKPEATPREGGVSQFT